MTSRSLSLRAMRTSAAPAPRRALAVRAFAPSKEKEASKASAPASKTTSKPSPQKGPISLKTHFVTEWGDELKIVSAPDWSLDSAAPMSWREGHEWEAVLPGEEVEADGEFEFKLVLRRADGAVVWEDGPNKVIGRSSSAPLRVSWGFPEVFEAGRDEDEGEVVVAAGASPSVAPQAEAVISDAAAASVVVSSGASTIVEEEKKEIEAAVEVPEEEAEAEVVEGETVASVAAPAADEAETAEAEKQQNQQNIQSAAAAAALGVGGALLATALAIDVADAAVVGAAAAAVAAVAGGNSAAGVAASRAAKAAAEAPEKLLRAAGLKSFAEREAEEKAREEAAEGESDE